MRLSDVRGERVFDVIADIIDPVCAIAQDEGARALFEPGEGDTPTEAAINRIRRGLPSLIKTHREDLTAILAAIKGVAPEEYAEDLSMGTLLGDVFELLTDEEFLAFLPSRGTTQD